VVKWKNGDKKTGKQGHKEKDLPEEPPLAPGSYVLGEGTGYREGKRDGQKREE